MAMPIMLNVSDLKQYLYCPRVVWYRYCQPVHRPVTYKMEDGKRAGRDVGALEQRRSLRAYGVASGRRDFEVWLQSEQLGLCGNLDMLITTEEERIPIEFKNSARVSINQKYQLVAYTLLLGEVAGPPVKRGFLYLIPCKRVHEVTVTPGIQSYVTRNLADMRRMVEVERYPAPTGVKARHNDCEFRPYCLDLD